MDTKEYKAIITPEAYRAISRIYEYISEDLYAKKVASNLMKLIERAIQYLKYDPKKHKKIERTDDLQRNYRRIVIKNYILLFTIDEIDKKVYVSHMFYKKRNYL